MTIEPEGSKYRESYTALEAFAPKSSYFTGKASHVANFKGGREKEFCMCPNRIFISYCMATTDIKQKFMKKKKKTHNFGIHSFFFFPFALHSKKYMLLTCHLGFLLPFFIFPGNEFLLVFILKT